MQSLVFTGISELTTWDPQRPVIEGQAALICDDQGLVAWVGEESALPQGTGDARVDLGGRALIPGFVDCHTHLVFGGERSAEWAARMEGSSYQAGGIRTTVSATRSATDHQLAARTARLAAQALADGTTTLEIKSGYGLDVATEERILAVAGTVTEETTFLGAHVVPAEYSERPDDHVDLVCGEMLRCCSPLAHWMDVFCEQGAFDPDQSRAVLLAGRAAGLGLRMHANQLSQGPGVRLAVEMGATSVDHCTHLDSSDVDALAASETVATLLPGAEFSTRSTYPDARRLLDSGATVALASDCNPGSSFTSSMPLMVALGVREMYMSPDEALWSATAGGAAALGRTDIGTLSPGSRADLVVLEAPSARWLGYRPGMNLVKQVYRGGQQVHPT